MAIIMMQLNYTTNIMRFPNDDAAEKRSSRSDKFGI